MTVLHTSLALAGVAAIAIPIIIHLLFRQRKKPVPWAAMRFLMEAYRKARRRMQIEQWLLLFIRCAMVFLLGLALARLLLTGAQTAGLFGPGGRVVYLLIDNSVASSIEYDDRTGAFAGESALDLQKAAALEVIDSLSPSDRVGLITLAEPVQVIVDPPAVDHGAVRQLVSNIRPSDAPTDLASGLRSLKNAIDQAEDDATTPVVACVFSEFRRGAADLGTPIDTTFTNMDRPVTFLAMPPATAPVSNVQITSIDPVRVVSIPGASDGSGQLQIRLRRTGDVSQSAITSLRVQAPGLSAPDSQTIEWDAGQAEAQAEVRFDLTSAEPGAIRLTASIDPDALVADNDRFTTLEVRNAMRVGVVDRREIGLSGDIHRMSSGAWFRRAIDPGEASPLVSVDVDPSVIEPVALRDLDALIVTRPDLVTTAGWQAMATFVRDGGLLWLVPSAEQDVALWAEDARDALNLPWMWKREVVHAPEGQTFALSADQPESALLGMLSSELEGLLRPVHITKYLPIESGLDPNGSILQLDLPSEFVSGSDQNESGPIAPPVLGNGDDSNQGRDGMNPLWSTLMAETGPPGAAGFVVYLAVPPHLEWTSLPAQPFMVALVQETIRQGIGSSQMHGEMAAGSEASLIVPQTAAALRYPETLSGDVTSDLPETILLERNGSRGQPIAPLEYRGFYAVVDSSDRVVDHIAVNVAVNSARTETQSAAEVQAWLNSTTGGTNGGSNARAQSGNDNGWTWLDESNPAGALAPLENTGSDISWYLLFIVLGLLVIESALARIFSHATLGTTGASDKGPRTGLEETIQRLSGSTSPPPTSPFAAIPSSNSTSSPTAEGRSSS